MDPFIHGSAAGAAAGAAASAATACTHYVIKDGALRALLYLPDKVHTVAAEAEAPAAAPAADPLIHGSIISFILNRIFHYEMTSNKH